jgi:2-(1,2-epoxy-1,2-dihydrophenyl)acetyl-CoA isomerase
MTGSDDGQRELLLQIESGVAVLTLNRPNSLNALSVAMMDELPDVLSGLASDPEVRCLIVTGAGRGFCAGADLKQRQATLDELAALPEDERIVATRLDTLEGRLTTRVDAARILYRMRKPTIAMINGPCAGAGFALAGACDLRVAGASAMMTTAFLRAGLSGDYGGTYFWTQILGTAQTRELYFLAPKINAEEALRRGMVHRVFSDDILESETGKLAREMAQMAPWAMNYAKRNLNLAAEGQLEQVLEAETMAIGIAARSARESGSQPSHVLR